MQLVAHGLSIGALFMLAGALQERLYTRDMRQMGGLWGAIPRVASMALFFALASLGLPGLANFIGEFLVLFGSFASQPFLTILASIGMVMAAIYSLAMMQRTFFGRKREARIERDLSNIAFGTLLLIAVLQVWLGLYPRPVLTTTMPVMETLIQPARPSSNLIHPPSEFLPSSNSFTSHVSAP